MNLRRPLRFESSPPLRLAPLSHRVPFTRLLSPAVPQDKQVALLEFNRLIARYKRAGYEWGQIWTQSLFDSLLTPFTYPPLPMIVQVIIEPFESVDWVVKEWTIKFMLSERLLTHARKQSGTPNWYEDPLIAATWGGVIAKCFRSVQAYYTAFAILPMVGDRLFNEDTGWLIQDRSIDGDLMTITFTLDG